MRAAKHYRQLLSIDFNIEALAFVLDPTAHAAGASTSSGARSATGPAWSSTFRRRSARGWRWTATARPISMQCCTWRTPIISNGATHEAPKLRHAARRCRAGRLVVASPAWAELRGEVVRIIDGDTIDVLVDKQPVRVRLVDIDAPEKRQAFGERARQALAGMVFRRHVLVDEKDTDRYGRTLGTVWVNMELASRPPQPRNVNAAMVHQGMAWAYRFHGRAADPEMLRLEQEARGKRVGLWSDPHAVEPWKWRRESNNRRDEG